MAYISNADIQERLGSQTYVQLTDDDGDAVADVGVVDEARLGAEGEVNSYLARRYRVPIDLAVNPELADLLATITQLEFSTCGRANKLQGVYAEPGSEFLATGVGLVRGLQDG